MVGLLIASCGGRRLRRAFSGIILCFFSRYRAVFSTAELFPARVTIRLALCLIACAWAAGCAPGFRVRTYGGAVLPPAESARLHVDERIVVHLFDGRPIDSRGTIYEMRPGRHTCTVTFHEPTRSRYPGEELTLTLNAAPGHDYMISWELIEGSETAWSARIVDISGCQSIE